MKHLLNILFFVSIIFSHIQAQTSVNSNQISLYERLGKTEGIRKIVDDVVMAHMNNLAIKARFEPYSFQPERLAEIKKHTVDFFVAGSGGPSKYTGRDMPTAHKGMNISQAEYMNVIDDILSVLDKYKIDEASKKDVLAILWSMKSMIVAQ